MKRCASIRLSSFVVYSFALAAFAAAAGLLSFQPPRHISRFAIFVFIL